MIKSIRLILSVLLVFSAAAGFCATRYWTGAAGDSRWNNKDNWSGSTLPTYGDTVVFTNDIPLSVRVGPAQPLGTIYRFERSDVTFGSEPDERCTLYMCNSAQVFVAPGCTVTSSNSVTMYNKGSLSKAGGGVFRMIGSPNIDGQPKTQSSLDMAPSLDIQEGEFHVLAKDGSSYGAYLASQLTNVTVRAGAVLRTAGYNMLSQNTVYLLEKGASMYVNAKGSFNNISSLVGEGHLEMTSNSRLQINFINGASEFSGKITGGGTVAFVMNEKSDAANRRFLVGDGDTLAGVDVVDNVEALAFAAGVGTFNIKSLTASVESRLLFEDVEGHPVSLQNGKSVGYYKTGWSVLKTPNFLPVQLSGAGTNRITGGEVWLANENGKIRALELLGGLCVLKSGYAKATDSTAENPTTILLDGGSIGTSSRSAGTQYWYSLPAADEAFAVYVGENGGRIESMDYPARYCDDSMVVRTNARFETAPGCQRDGGVVFDLRRTGVIMRPYRPFLISGPFTVQDGYMQLGCYSKNWLSDIATYPEFFGTGDFILDHGVLGHKNISNCESNLPHGATLKLASGDGSRFIFRGSSLIRFREDSGLPSYDIVIGAESAAENSAMTRSRGGALFLYDDDNDLGGDSSLKVNGGVAVHEGGKIPKIPVFFEKYLDGHREVFFTEYDDQLGFVKYEGGVSSFSESEGKIVTLPDSAMISSGNIRSALGLRIEDWKSLNIKDGARLQLGNGQDPACVIIEYQADISGSGTIDFGGSEGVIVIGMHYGTGYPEGHNLSCRLSGENGVSYVAMPDYNYHLVRVAGENTYAGPTYVSTAALAVRNKRAFSSGDVYVTGGSRNGGKVIFDRPLEIDNSFHVSGAGHRLKLSWGDRAGGWGALSFQTNDVVLTGSVEIDSMAMVSAQSEGYEGTFKGVVSGGRLQVYDGDGRVVLAAPNTYTGGTEIVKSTLVLAGASPSAGTGTVVFDNGILRFENISPLVFANRIEGVGRIELAGAPVTFASPDFAGLALTNLAAGSVINLESMAESVLVAAVGAGGLDLGGRDLTVAGVAGTGRISGGTLTVTGEINPGGAGTIGKLTFEKAPVLSGAVYVCDIIGEETDEIAVEDDFSLSGLSFRAASPQGRNHLHYDDTVTVGAGKSLSGEFAGTEYPRGLYSMSYLECSARIFKTTPLRIILR